MKIEDKIGWHNSFKEKFSEKPLFLIKYCSEEKHAIDVSQGKLYVNDAKFYANLEKESGVKGTGDKREMVSDIPEGYTAKIKSQLTGETVKFVIDNNANVSITMNRDLDTVIYCTTGVKIPDINEVQIKETKDKIIFKFTKKLDDMDILSYKYCTIIKPDNFFKALTEYFSIKDIRWNGKFITYTDDINERFEVMKKIGDTNRYFLKDTYFSNQNEFRIAIDMKVPNNNIIDLNSTIGFVSKTGVEIELIIEAFKN